MTESLSITNNSTGFSRTLEFLPTENNVCPIPSMSFRKSALSNFLTTKVEHPEIYEDILARVSTFSFKADVFLSNPLLKESLRNLLPRMHQEIIERSKFDDVTISIALDIATVACGENVAKFSVNDERRLAFEACFVMLYAIFGHNIDDLIIDTEAFDLKYPEFVLENVSVLDKQILLNFRNFMAVAQYLIGAKQHKNHLMDLVTRVVEGKTVRYVGGSGQPGQTSRRVLIFRREGNVPLVSKSSSKCPAVPSSEDIDVVGKPSAGRRQPAKKREKHLKYLSNITISRQKGLQDIRKQSIAVFVPDKVTGITPSPQTSLVVPCSDISTDQSTAPCVTDDVVVENTSIWGNFSQMHNIHLLPATNDIQDPFSREHPFLKPDLPHAPTKLIDTTDHDGPIHQSLSLSAFISFSDDWMPNLRLPTTDQNKSSELAAWFIACRSLSDSILDAAFIPTTSMNEMIRGMSA